MITAINKKYQSVVNRFVAWEEKYSSIVAATDDDGGLKQERAYDKACVLFLELPKREQLNIARAFDCNLKTFGYGV